MINYFYTSLSSSPNIPCEGLQIPNVLSLREFLVKKIRTEELILREFFLADFNKKKADFICVISKARRPSCSEIGHNPWWLVLRSNRMLCGHPCPPNTSTFPNTLVRSLHAPLSCATARVSSTWFHFRADIYSYRSVGLSPWS